MELTIIIPAYNEEKIIIQTLDDIKKKVKASHKIIVVNDCSSDQTGNIVKEYAKKHKNVSCIRTDPKAHGFANALKKGFSVVKKGVIVPVMADLCDESETIDKMYLKIQEGWDVVCGSRYMKGGRKEGGPILQHYLSLFVCRSLQLLTGVPTSDVSNAFKMYKKKWLNQVKINPNSGVEASMEILLQAYFKGAKITEVPTKWRGRTAGISKFKILERAPCYLRIYLFVIEKSLIRSISLIFRKFCA